MIKHVLLFVFLLMLFSIDVSAQGKIAGRVLDDRNEPVAGVTVRVSLEGESNEVITESDGSFKLDAQPGEWLLEVYYRKTLLQRRKVSEQGSLEIVVSREAMKIYENLVIVAAGLEPSIERRNDTIYRNALFSRDDQVFHTLDAGINAGQHEGGGKSLEIRRFGFNLDHGGVNGGLKVLVDNLQQNQGTQGHGQGYLGQLKSLSPELIDEVEIVNGPFSAEYGDFSGLGVVHIKLRESLPQTVTLRLQGGSFDTFRSFLAYSPQLKSGNAFIAYEPSRTNGPFLNPLRYHRDNLTGSYTRNLTNATIGFKFNASRNNFSSSGQIPLDEVEAGRLDRFGFLDPDNGGRVRAGSFGAYYRRELQGDRLLRVDGFVARSLFDLYSNFTFFLNDEVRSDEIQQHDSRLQQGVNLQYLSPLKLFGKIGFLTAGGNFHSNQINVGLYNSQGRDPYATATSARASVTNSAFYLQQSFALNRLNVTGGLRYDHFRFSVTDRVQPAFSGSRNEGRWQPKAAISFTPSYRLPVTFYANYGRGITSQDARGVVQRPEGERVSSTDFYQTGVAYNSRRASMVASLFLIDRSSEQVYIPDDGSIELKGPSRAYGLEAKASVALQRHLSINGGITRVGNAFFRATGVYIDSAPHLTANAGLTLSDLKGYSASLRMRHISNYRLDGIDPSIRASGHTVLDLSVLKRINSALDLNLSIDNLTNKRYFETQNYFESRLKPGDPAISRIHATPGYPITVTMGVTVRLGNR